MNIEILEVSRNNLETICRNIKSTELHTELNCEVQRLTICIEELSSFEIILKGYDCNSDSTDHLVKWVLAPSTTVLNQWIEKHNLQNAIKSIGDMGLYAQGYSDGIDLVISESGKGFQPENNTHLKLHEETLGAHKVYSKEKASTWKKQVTAIKKLKVTA